MVEVKVNGMDVRIEGSGKTFIVCNELVFAMVCALRQMRGIDKNMYKVICAWIKDGHLIEESEKDD